MKLLAPDLGLILWVVLSLLSLTVLTFAIIKLVKDKSLDPYVKLMWALGIILFPTIGATLYLLANRSEARRRINSH